jgi:aminoglycoside 3-N-acetyltransferase
VSGATLEISEPAVDDTLLADYGACTQGLMTYSAPTPPGGLVADVVVVDEAARAESFDGVDVERKLVLVDCIGIDVWRNAVARGAAGVISDYSAQSGSPRDDGSGRLDDAVHWHNYTIPPWKTEPKGFGFSLSPAAGRRLRELIETASPVRLRARVDTRLYEGVLPLVTGLLPGQSGEEIALTAHLCEPGANDDSSGVALGLETARTVGALARAGGVELRRGLRLFFSFEVRGLQALLASKARPRRLVAGIDLDMVGHDPTREGSVLDLVYNFPASPAFTDHLALALVRQLGEEVPGLRHRVLECELVDNVFGDPAVGAPMCVLGSWPDAEYHNSLDVIDAVSPAALSMFGRVAATYCAFLAGAGPLEARRLAELIEEENGKELLDVARAAERLGAVAERNVERLASIARLVRPRGFIPTAEELARNADWRDEESGFFEDELLARRLEGASGRVRAAARELVRGKAGDPAREGGGPADTEAAAHALVPLRLFEGALSFELLDATARDDLRARTGIGTGWGAPRWAAQAAMLATGRRTVAAIHERLRRDLPGISYGELVGLFEFLRDHGLARMRPVLTGADIREALRAVGLAPGSVTLVHSSLSMFGYVEGGAPTVIDTIREALSPAGTLVMPAFSCSFAGHPPFDRATTPSRVGAVTECFRARDGVLRSAHPTHSLAAHGPEAERITRHHSPSEPVFADTGSFGALYELDAQVLMLAPLKSNTCMHMGEERTGVPLRDVVASVADGTGRREVRVARAPWHVDSFEEHYRVLRERGMIRDATLGEERVHLMRYRDAVDVATENLRRRPLLAAAPGCECSTCLSVRASSSGARAERREVDGPRERPIA